MRSRGTIASVAAVLAVIMTGQAYAAEAEAAEDQAASATAKGNDEILVVAQRREENIQSVPVAVTVVSSERLESRGTFDPTDLGRVSVGLNATPFNGDRTNVYYTLRGQSFSTGTLFPAVVPYFAEVPLNKLLVGTFYDLANIQTLRGPQGTLFGRVTDGGAILLQPRKPSDNFEGYVQVKAGSYDLRQANGAVNLPIVDGKLAVRAAFEIARRDGFTRNFFNGRKLDGVSYESGRLSILAKPVEGFENYTTISYTHGNDNGGSAQILEVNPTAVIATVTPVFGAAGAAALATSLVAALQKQQAVGPRGVYNDTDSFDRRRQLVVTNATTIELTPDIKARAILGFIHLRQMTANDYDGTELPFTNIVNNYVPVPTAYQDQYSGELQLQGTSMGGKFDWTLGTYVDKQVTPGPSELASLSLSAFYRYQVQYFRTTSLAFYGQGTLDISSLLDAGDMKLIGGLRYTKDTVFSRQATYTVLSTQNQDLVPHGQCLTTIPAVALPSSIPCQTFNADFNIMTWNAGLEWKPTDGLFIYTKVSKGYRPGGFNAAVTVPSYGPETVISKELGIKADLDLGGMPTRLNTALFFDDFKNVQRLVTLVEGSGAVAVNLNAASAKVSGLETELQIRPIGGLTLGANLAYFFNKSYDVSKFTPAHIAAACPSDPRTQRADPTKFCPLNPLARTPNTVTLTANYRFGVGNGEVSLAGDWYFSSSQYYASAGYLQPEAHAPKYNVLNLNASWSLESLPLEIGVFCTNVLDKTYVATNSSVTQLGSLGIANYSFGPPRMYGASVRFRFE